MLRNSSSGYGVIAILFHWTMALLIVGMIALGFYMNSLPQTQAFALYQVHKSFGFVVLTIGLLRLVWRLFNPSPALPGDMPFWERAGAHLGHLGLYLLIFALPLSGWLMVSASPWNIPTILFNTLHVPHLPVPTFLGDKASAEALMKSVHLTLVWVLIALLFVHVSAALKHHFLVHDKILKRMLSPRHAREGSQQ